METNYLHHLFIIIIFIRAIFCETESEDLLQMEDDSFTTLYEYPCDGVKGIVESFSPSDALTYNVTIVPANFESYFPKIITLKLKFDALTNFVQHYDPAWGFSDSYTIESKLKILDKENITTQIQPYNDGDSVPNLLSVKIDNNELCVNGVKKDIWSKYIKILPKININSSSNKLISKKKSEFKFDENGISCGQRLIQHEGLIFNGEDSKPGDWPWHSTLYRLKSTDYLPEYICGGTLISKTRVITAAHCIIENGAVLLAQRLLVSFGKNNFYGDDIGLQEKTVFQILVHWQFVRTNLTNDLAVLILATEVTLTDYVQPICLWNVLDVEYNIFGKIGHVVGWGATENSKFSRKLQHATMIVRPDLQCIKTNPNFYGRFLTDTTYCAGYGNGTNVCNGDSGSGMYFPKRDPDGQETWYLRGIVSLGIAKRDEIICDPYRFTIFTDCAQYIDVIKGIL